MHSVRLITYVYIGSYTNTTAKGIYVSEFDSKSGALSAPRLVAESVSPAQLWVAPNGRFLYAANWQGSTDPIPANTISAYAIDRRTGDLTFINKVSSGGLGPNQVVVDPWWTESAVAVNYRSGSVAAFGLEKDGRISEAFYIDQHEGQPQPPSKQPGPRAHGVVFSSDSRFAYVADIGLDRVLQLSPRRCEADDGAARPAVCRAAGRFGAATAAAASERQISVPRRARAIRTSACSRSTTGA